MKISGVIVIFIFISSNLFAQDIKDAYNVEKPPVCINSAKVSSLICYPDSARINKIEGRVTVKLLVDTNGTVSKIGSFTGPEIFKEEVTANAVYLLFIPAVSENKFVNCWVSVPFSFKLSKTETDEK